MQGINGFRAFILMVVVASLVFAGCNKNELNQIAELYLAGDLGAALQELEVHLEKNPDDDMAWTMQGNILLDLDRDSAKASFQKAILINPKNFQATNSLGVFARKKGDDASAMMYYKRALEIRPGYAQAYSSMSVIELKQHNDAQAIEYGKLAYENDPADPVIAANLAIVYHYIGDLADRDKLADIARQNGYQKMDSLLQIFAGNLTVREEYDIEEDIEE